MSQKTIISCSEYPKTRTKTLGKVVKEQTSQKQIPSKQWVKMSSAHGQDEKELSFIQQLMESCNEKARLA